MCDPERVEQFEIDHFVYKPLNPSESYNVAMRLKMPSSLYLVSGIRHPVSVDQRHHDQDNG
jgi:hypothetical protein